MLEGAKAEIAPQDPWNKVINPAHVYIKCLQGLGWAALWAQTFATDEKRIIDYRKFPPKQVVELAKAAARRASDKVSVAACVAGAGGWAAAVCWEPLRRLMAVTCGALVGREKASLRCLLGNTVWSQIRLHSKGRARAPNCLACGCPEGTLWHQRFACPAFAARRRQDAPAALLLCAERVRSFDAAAAELFARGVCPDPAALLYPRPAGNEDDVEWINRPPSGRLTGTIFSDGSALFPALPALLSSGWALASVDAFGWLISAVFGPVPLEKAPFQTSRDAEDYAARMLTFYAEPPFRLYTDCSGTLRCLNEPPGRR